MMEVKYNINYLPDGNYILLSELLGLDLSWRS